MPAKLDQVFDLIRELIRKEETGDFKIRINEGGIGRVNFDKIYFS